jgi:hypothetical protein
MVLIKHRDLYLTDGDVTLSWFLLVLKGFATHSFDTSPACLLLTGALSMWQCCLATINTIEVGYSVHERGCIDTGN